MMLGPGWASLHHVPLVSSEQTNLGTLAPRMIWKTARANPGTEDIINTSDRSVRSYNKISSFRFKGTIPFVY